MSTHAHVCKTHGGAFICTCPIGHVRIMPCEQSCSEYYRALNAQLLAALEHGQSLATGLLTERVGGRSLPIWMLAMIRDFSDEAEAAIAAAEKEEA